MRIDAAQTLIESNDIAGQRKVIDLSADSANSWGGMPIFEARARALAADIVINGLAILCRDCSGRPNSYDLEAAFAETIIGGPASFVVTADRDERFTEAVRRKLLLEIAGSPPPPSAGPALRRARHRRLIGRRPAAPQSRGPRRLWPWQGGSWQIEKLPTRRERLTGTFGAPCRGGRASMNRNHAEPAYRADDLIAFAAALFRSAGLEDEKARTVAEVLVEGDLLGHTTHGLALAAPYLTRGPGGQHDRRGRAER